MKSKRQKLTETTEKIVYDEESDGIFNLENDLSPNEIIEKQNKTKEISKKMQELEKEKDKIEEELNKGNKLKEMYDSFKKERDEFVFKIDYEDGEFHETSGRNYVGAILKSVAQQQGKEDLKVLKFKSILNYIWLKTNHKIVLKWLSKKVPQRDTFSGFSITQLRADNFFNDI